MDTKCQEWFPVAVSVGWPNDTKTLQKLGILIWEQSRCLNIIKGDLTDEQWETDLKHYVEEIHNSRKCIVISYEGTWIVKIFKDNNLVFRNLSSQY